MFFYWSKIYVQWNAYILIVQFDEFWQICVSNTPSKIHKFSLLRPLSTEFSQSGKPRLWFLSSLSHFVNSWTSYKWNHTVCIPLCLTFPPQCNDFYFYLINLLLRIFIIVYWSQTDNNCQKARSQMFPSTVTFRLIHIVACICSSFLKKNSEF